MKILLRRTDDLKKASELLEAEKSKMPPKIVSAHVHCSRHRTEVLASDLCGCFYCGQTFGPSEIVRWLDNENTAICPKCGIDSVIGTASGFPVTKEFLDEMHQHWFS